jgi:SAM-dependent methyltransferase
MPQGGAAIMATPSYDIKSFWSNHAETWADNRKPYFAYREQVVLGMLERSARRGSVLEVGCGAGDLSARLQERGWTAYGTDMEPKLIEVAGKRNGVENRFRVHDCTTGTMPFGSQRFDVATAIGLLPCLDHHDKFLSWMRDCLAPNGYAVVGVTKNISWHTFDEILSWMRNKDVAKRKGVSTAAMIRGLLTTGLWPPAGGVVAPKGVQIHSAGALDRSMKRLGFERVDWAGLFNMGTAADAQALERTGVWKFAARHLGWNYVGVYQLLRR